MKNIDFIDKYGTFRIKNPENYSGLYLPLAGEKGLKSSITPTLGGDSKTSQNTFLLEPVSIENLHNNKGTRNFWCRIVGKGFWSVCGSSVLLVISTSMTSMLPSSVTNDVVSASNPYIFEARCSFCHIKPASSSLSS